MKASRYNIQSKVLCENRDMTQFNQKWKDIKEILNKGYGDKSSDFERIKFVQLLNT